MHGQQLQPRLVSHLQLHGASVGIDAEHDNKRASEGCAGQEEGEIVVFDKAYADFAHLHDLDLRGVQWVTRAKDDFRCRTVRNLPRKEGRQDR